MRGFLRHLAAFWLAAAWLLFAATAAAQGLFWKVEPPQGGAPSYLFGTIHTDDKRVTAFPDAVSTAMKSVDQFMMETLPPADQQVLMMPEGTLRDWLAPSEMEQVVQLADTLGLPDGFALRLKPWLLAVMLAQPRAPSPFFQDMLLYAMAANQGKQIGSLERAEAHFAALDGLSMAEQLTLLRSVLAQTQAEKEQAYETLLQAYLEQDAEHVLAVNEALSREGLPAPLWEKVREALLDRRNQLMAIRIMAAMTDRTVFVAVGAAHLAGPGGLLERLRAGGFRLSEVK